jgi:hypothetical protein
MLGSKGKVKLDPDLLDRAKKAAETAGYSNVEEFLNHLVEKELKKIETATTEAKDEDELKERLKGLGYIS